MENSIEGGPREPLVATASPICPKCKTYFRFTDTFLDVRRNNRSAFSMRMRSAHLGRKTSIGAAMAPYLSQWKSGVMSAQPDLDQASHSFDPVQARVVLLFDPLVQLFDLLLIEKGLERVVFVALPARLSHLHAGRRQLGFAGFVVHCDLQIKRTPPGREEPTVALALQPRALKASWDRAQGKAPSQSTAAHVQAIINRNNHLQN